MALHGRPRGAGWAAVGLAAALAGGGCAAHRQQVVPLPDMPKELNKVDHPPYRVEPPDVIQIDLVAAVPKPPYRIQPLDALAVRVSGTDPQAPIEGVFSVDLEGNLFLGPRYGSVAVSGLSVTEAKAAVEKHLLKGLNEPVADVSLAQTRAVQQVRGPHLVRQDGTVWLGTYGAVRVTGLTVPEVQAAIEEQLGRFFQTPQVSVDVVGYNSKVYYFVYDGGRAGTGLQVTRLPVTGNETVLDAVANLSGLPAAADARRVWVSRPRPDGCPDQTLPVDLPAITERGDTRTNYQLLPGDRVFVKALPIVEFDTTFARVISPFERLFGFTLLGTGTVQQIKFFNNPNFGGGF